MRWYFVLLLCILVGAVCAAAAFYAGTLYRKKISEAKIGSAEEEANRIVSDAIKKAEAKKKEILLNKMVLYYFS